VFINYDTFDEWGNIEPVDVGWNLIDNHGKWEVGDFIADDIDEEEFGHLADDLATVLEECLNHVHS
jgi:hypothetical protein